MPAGRPSEYSDKFGEEMISLMSTGLSLTAAAADLGFHRDTIYEWEKRHPEFSDAIKLARGKRVLTLERGLFAADAGHKVTAHIFALKNADPAEWREKHEIVGKDGEALIPPSSDTRELAKAIVTALQGAVKPAE